MRRRGSTVAHRIGFAAALVIFGCAATPTPQDEYAILSCRSQATVTERVRLTAGFVTTSFFDLEHLDAARYQQCIRASGVPEVLITPDLERAEHESDCRSSALEAVPSSGAPARVEPVLDKARYDSCLAAAP